MAGWSLRVVPLLDVGVVVLSVVRKNEEAPPWPRRCRFKAAVAAAVQQEERPNNHFLFFSPFALVGCSCCCSSAVGTPIPTPRFVCAGT